MKMNISTHTKIYLGISALMVVSSVTCLAVWGLKWGIDFTGGSLLELAFSDQRPSSQEIKEKLSGMDLGRITIQAKDERSLVLRLKDIDEKTHQEILTRFGEAAVEKQFESIGPVIGSELKQKSVYAILLSLVGIVLYMAWAFRRVSRPVASWKYGLVAVVALMHDIVITTGFFSILGHYNNTEIVPSLIAAFLTILGYSVNNTIVVFDRLRENLMIKNWPEFKDAVDASTNQSLTRCLNTALTTILALLAIYFLAGEGIRPFALALIFGITVGTYSSIFVTTSLILIWHQRQSGR